jgi:hypothetical protein
LDNTVYAAAAHTSGYNRGCSDAGISNPADRYINQPEKGPSFHSKEFMNAYNAGFNACSGDGRGNSGGGNEFASNSEDQSGYSLTVNVPYHPFGHAWVYIWMKTANGYEDSRRVGTAGGTSWTFNVPPNQGHTVEACVSASLLSSNNCQRFIVSGHDMEVSLSAL